MSTSVTPFDPASKLVVVEGLLWGPRGKGQDLLLAVDTGAEMTTLKPHVLDAVGYSARMGERIARVSSAVGSEDTYTIRVRSLWVLGFDAAGFLVNAADLSDHGDIDGLVGLDILRRFDCLFRFSAGEIVLTPIDGPAGATTA